MVGKEVSSEQAKLECGEAGRREPNGLYFQWQLLRDGLPGTVQPRLPVDTAKRKSHEPCLDPTFTSPPTPHHPCRCKHVDGSSLFPVSSFLLI